MNENVVFHQERLILMWFHKTTLAVPAPYIYIFIYIDIDIDR